MKKIKKFLKRFFLFIISVLVFWILMVALPALFYSKEKNSNPLPSGYMKGVYHMHSVFSDGRGTVDDITKAAASLHLDFAILTDHGEPNVKSAASTSFMNGTLLIGGSELSLHCGHLAAIGFKEHDYIFPPEPQESINEIIDDNGICFVAHPFDSRIPWTDWRVSGFTGIEIFNTYSAAMKLSYFTLAAFPIRYFINSDYALTNAFEYPHENIKKWDSINLNPLDPHIYYCIYAQDAHAKLPITESYSLDFPTYKSMFSVLTIYVKTGEKEYKDPHVAASAVTTALKKGHFFNVIESISSANGFEAVFIDSAGRKLEIGDTTPATQGKLEISLPFDFETEVVIKRNGSVFKRIKNNTNKKLEIEISQSGFYYIEVYAVENTFRQLPWILTNPFFIGFKAPFNASVSTPREQESDTIVQDKVALTERLVNKKGFFNIETNPSSTGTLSYDLSDEGEMISILEFKLERDKADGQVATAYKKDFWCALGARRKFDFSKYKGIILEAKGNENRRFWLELRTRQDNKEMWFRHSFLVEPQWKSVHIPFELFYMIHSEQNGNTLIESKNFPMDPSRIETMFISINNANAYPGTSGQLSLKNFGLY